MTAPRDPDHWADHGPYDDQPDDGNPDLIEAMRKAERDAKRELKDGPR